MSKTRILIADDHQIVIDGVKRLLTDQPEFEVVGEALDGYQVLEQAKSLQPDVVIMDISMPGLSGLEAAVRMKKWCPETRIVVFTMYSNEEYIVDLFKAGISGYVLKKDPTSELILAIKAVMVGGHYFCGAAPSILVRHMKELAAGQRHEDKFESLSLREREVLCLLVEGRSIKEIADQLCISSKTVATHKYNIMGKLDAPSMAHLVKIAIRKNLTTL